MVTSLLYVKGVIIHALRQKIYLSCHTCDKGALFFLPHTFSQLSCESRSIEDWFHPGADPEVSDVVHCYVTCISESLVAFTYIATVSRNP